LTTRDTAIELFRQRFGGDPEYVIRAPGRVNLIGEHTDYNDGFVLPMAIEQGTWLALSSSGDRTVQLSSDGHDDAVFSLDALTSGGGGWAEYIKGVAWSLGTADSSGWNGAFATDIPIGAGLSSSAAIEIAGMLAFTAVSGSDWDPVQAALDAQRVENEWIGVSSGIMDQLIVATAQEHHATLIDCRSLEMSPTRMPDDIAVVILDTGTRRTLVGSGYDDRRRACERAASAADVPALRDLTTPDLDNLSSMLDETTFRRARHVITENERTIQAARALDTDDIRRFGELVNESHASLRDDFEVSSPALDLMVEIASRTGGCIGARMTGGGFGGCAVAFVERSQVDAFVEEVTRKYRGTATNEPMAYVTSAAGAASIEGT